MSQHSLKTPTAGTVSGVQLSDNVNAIAEALATNSSGAGEPGTTYPYMWWADTTANILKRRNAGNTAWISVMSLSLAISTFAETLLDDADAAAARTTLGLATIAASGSASDLSTGSVAQARLATALNASGSAPLYACRAWVNFNGAGTVVIRSSGNVSSITDNGNGDYTINFSAAMPDADYARAAWGDWPNTAAGGLVSGSQTDSKTASACRIRTVRSTDFVPTDLNEVCAVFFR